MLRITRLNVGMDDADDNCFRLNRSGDAQMAGMNRKVLGWMFYDWASQPYATLLLTFIFGPYFASAVMDDPVQAQKYWGWMLGASGIIIAVLAPVLGAVSDRNGERHTWVFAFSVLYVAGAGALWWATPGSDHILLILVAFGIGLIGVELGTVITNGMLPDLGDRKQIGMISGQGWAFGYLGGLISLAIVLMLLAEGPGGKTLAGIEPILGLDPELREGTRLVGPLTAAWYALFMVPFFMWTPARKAVRETTEGLKGLIRTLSGLPRHKSLFSYLISSMLYRDALNGVFAFGGIYAVGVLEWPITMVGAFGIAGLAFGAVFAWMGGIADRRFGPWPVIMSAIVVLTLICIIIVTITRESVLTIPVDTTSRLPDSAFFLCGCLIGAAGGAIQSASRTMMVNQANQGRMAEAFGLYTLSGKATSFIAPLMIAWFTDMFASQRVGVMPLIFLFAISGLVLLMVSRDNA